MKTCLKTAEPKLRNFSDYFARTCEPLACQCELLCERIKEKEYCKKTERRTSMCKLAEIKVDGEMITRQQMIEYLKGLFEKYIGDHVHGESISFWTKYVSIQLKREIDMDASNEMKEEIDTVSIEATIRTMGGSMSVDDLVLAADELKGAARVVEKFNDRMDGVMVIWF